jgi:hypothetical protein
MKNIFTILLTICAAVPLHAADVRIVGTAHVDLTPIHDWENDKSSERPMKHWKKITIEDFTPGGPWPICSIKIEGAGKKTIYLKNIPAQAMQCLNQLSQMNAQIKFLSQQVASDIKNLRDADAVHAEFNSQFDQNRDTFRARLRNNQDRLDELTSQRDELLAKQIDSTSDLAMFTGQTYNKMEVWDCGQKSQ